MFPNLCTFVPMQEPILSIDSLTTGYSLHRQRRVVAEQLSAVLPAGSFTALIGVNGAGKSTLLRTLAGLQPPLSGDIRWKGKSLSDYSARSLSHTLSVVLTSRTVHEGLLAGEVVEMGRMPYTRFDGRLSPEDSRLVAEAMERVGMSALARRPMGSLSDGERQRVMIAKALAQQTPVILLDEPTAYLDFPSKVSLLQLLRRLSAEDGKTVLLSTHDLELTFQLAERLWLLSPGGLTAGSPQELAASGMIERFFHADGWVLDAEQLRFRWQ